MTDHTLTVTLLPHASGASVLTLVGEVDHHTAPEFQAVVDQAPFTPETPVVIDLAGLTYCDSTGITALIKAHLRAHDTSTRLVFAAPHHDLMHLLRIVGLDQVFTFCPTAADALDAVHQPTES
ncbi:STAS domain-containing protein [Streptomyces sp. NPDC088785]|uniref:STAS domain-containing protein n=1 Tax=Streptomyces sp. NPDC088785 TaxID=3365897 RepID=UPI0038057B16